MASPGASNDSYIFNRNFRSSIRLNYNHWLVTQTAGYLLNPKVPRDKPDLRVADVATGTAIWPLEPATQLPSTVQLHAFDISSDQFPPATSRPPNLHLHVHDAFKPFPAEFQGAFDVVAMRFMLCVVNNPDAPNLIKNLALLLKPGGYLQWFELLPMTLRAIPALDEEGKEQPSPALEKVASQWKKPRPNTSYEWVKGLPGLFTEEGLQVVAADIIPFQKRYRLFWAHSHLAGMEDMIANTQLVDNETVETVRKDMGSFMEEAVRGGCVENDFTCVVGHKLA